MDAIATVISIALPALGWGGLAVSSGMRASLGGGWGSRLLLGLGILTLLLYVFNVVLDAPLGLTARITAGAGIGLLGLGLYRNRDELSWWKILSHPVTVFCVLLVALAWWQGPAGYLPYAWDEYTNWLGASKQIFFKDTWIAPDMHYPHPEYPPGWRLLVIYPSLVLGRYDEYHALFTLSVMHFGFLGMVFEVIEATLKSRSRWSAATRRLLSWAILLCLILVEATWKLIPQDVLIERPQIYLFTAGILLAVLAGERKTDRLGLAAGLGLIMAFGYLIKSSMIVFIPSLLLIGGYLVLREVNWSRQFTARQFKNSVLIVALVVLPFVATYLSWQALKTGSRCNSSILQLLQPDSLTLIVGEQAGRIGADYMSALFGYLFSYKAPVTLFAVLSLGWALRDARWRLGVLTLIVFIGTYILALYWNYLVCADWFNDYLSSLQRYIRVPLRSLHLIGLMFGLMATVLLLEKRFAATARIFAPALPAGVALLMAFTVWQANAALRETHQRRLEPYLAARVNLVREQLPALVSLTSKEAIKRPKILIISSAENEFDALVAGYLTIAIDPERALLPFAFSSLQIRKAGINYGNAPVSDAGIRAILEQNNVIWPLESFPALRDALLEMTGNASCAERPTDYFIVAGPNDGNSYSCESK